MTPLGGAALAWAALHHPVGPELRTAADHAAALPPGPLRDRRARVLLSACPAAERALDAQDTLPGDGTTAADRRLLGTVRRDLWGMLGVADPGPT